MEVLMMTKATADVLDRFIRHMAQQTGMSQAKFEARFREMFATNSSMTYHVEEWLGNHDDVN
jgi:hypothetical protein